MKTSPRSRHARTQTGPRSNAPHAASFPDAPSSVLWVDDDPKLIAQARTLAEQLLLHLDVATTPVKALEIIKSSAENIEVAFLNIDLAGDHAQPLHTEERSAPKWVSKICAAPTASHIPLGFLSARDDLQTRLWAARAGAKLFLNTPVAPGEFTQAIHQLVAIRRATPPVVLIVDQDPIFAHTLRRQLAPHGVQAVTRSDSTDVLAHLRRTNPDALIVDAQMPGINGPDLCRVLRTMSRWQDLPVLVMTPTDSLDARLATLEAGGDGVLTRQSTPEEFLACIQSHIQRSRLMRQRANRDPLTGLLTRRAFLESLAARLSEMTRKNQKLAFCLLDLDRFKPVNDTHGHLAGDRVLAGLGGLLLKRFRSEDLRARWGGEEFVVVMANEGVQNARKILERIRTEFANLEFEGINNEAFRVSFSAGIAEFPAHGRDVESLFNTADRQLYAAKAAGRNRILRTRRVH